MSTRRKQQPHFTPDGPRPIAGEGEKKKRKKNAEDFDGNPVAPAQSSGDVVALTWASRRLLSVRPSKRILSSASEELLRDERKCGKRKTGG